MKIEVGHAYYTRNTGEIVDIDALVETEGHCSFGQFRGTYRNGGHAYWSETGIWLGGYISDYDLVTKAPKFSIIQRPSWLKERMNETC